MIIRRQHTKRYTTVPSEIIDNSKLSFEELGALTYLLSRPNDWKVHLQQLCARGGIGRDRMRRIITKLIVEGYARREARREGNRIAGIEYVITDDPEPLKAKSQQTDFQGPENPTLLKTERHKNLLSPSLSGQRGATVEKALEDEEFQEALSLWQRHRNTFPQRRPESVKRARLAWDDLPETDRRDAAEFIGCFFNATKAAGRTWPIAFATYLRNWRYYRPPEEAA